MVHLLVEVSKRVGLSLAALLAALVIAELLASAWLRWGAGESDFRRFASIGQLEARYGAFDRFQSHRHLGYALSPNYKTSTNRHNRLGFRGDEVGERA